MCEKLKYIPSSLWMSQINNNNNNNNNANNCTLRVCHTWGAGHPGARVPQTTLLPRAAEMRDLPLVNVSFFPLLASLWCWGQKPALLTLGRGPATEPSHTSGFYSTQAALYSPAFLGRYSDLLGREFAGMHCRLWTDGSRLFWSWQPGAHRWDSEQGWGKVK